MVYAGKQACVDEGASRKPVHLNPSVARFKIFQDGNMILIFFLIIIFMQKNPRAPSRDIRDSDATYNFEGKTPKRYWLLPYQRKCYAAGTANRGARWTN